LGEKNLEVLFFIPGFTVKATVREVVFKDQQHSKFMTASLFRA
jgi:hypothetical protein